MNKLFYLIFLIFTHNALARFELETVIYDQEELNDSVQLEQGNGQIKEISDEVIKDQKASSIDDLLSESVEATTARGPRSSSQSIQVRGLDSNKIFVLVDGVRQNYREGHSAMNPVDIENLKQIEIFTDSSNFSYGNSLGGGVQFVTKEAQDLLRKNKDFGSEFKYQSSSANQEKRYNAKSVFNKNKISGLISLTSATAENLKLNDGNLLENSSYDDFSGLLKLKYKKFGFSFERYQRKDNNPFDPSLNPPSQFPDLLANSTLTKNSYLLTHDLENQKIKFYINQYETSKVDRQDFVEELRTINTIGFNFYRKNNSWNYGSEIFNDQLDSKLKSQVISSYPNASSLNTSLFVEKEFVFNKYKLVPGIKYNLYNLENDRVQNKSVNKLTKKLNQKLEIVEDTFLFLNYSEGFNSPKVTEVYPSGLHSPGDDFMVRDNYFIPNLNLKHETSQNKEFGFEINKSFSYLDKLTIKASFFQNDIKDYINIQRIDRSVLDSENGTSQFINIKNVETNGLEASVDYHFDFFKCGVSYAKIRGKDLDENIYLEDLPADQFVYTAKFYLDKYHANMGYSGIQALEQDRVNPQTLQRTRATSGYIVHNVYANKTFNDVFEMGIRVNNLGNKNYRRHASHINESAQDFRLTFQYKINTL